MNGAFRFLMLVSVQNVQRLFFFLPGHAKF